MKAAAAGTNEGRPAAFLSRPWSLAVGNLGNVYEV